MNSYKSTPSSHTPPNVYLDALQFKFAVKVLDTIVNYRKDYLPDDIGKYLASSKVIHNRSGWINLGDKVAITNGVRLHRAYLNSALLDECKTKSLLSNQFTDKERTAIKTMTDAGEAFDWSFQCAIAGTVFNSLKDYFHKVVLSDYKSSAPFDFYSTLNTVQFYREYQISISSQNSYIEDLSKKIYHLFGNHTERVVYSSQTQRDGLLVKWALPSPMKREQIGSRTYLVLYRKGNFIRIEISFEKLKTKGFKSTEDLLTILDKLAFAAMDILDVVHSQLNMNVTTLDEVGLVSILKKLGFRGVDSDVRWLELRRQLCESGGVYDVSHARKIGLAISDESLRKLTKEIFDVYPVGDDKNKKLRRIKFEILCELTQDF